jgi:hypothetical protein
MSSMSKENVFVDVNLVDLYYMLFGVEDIEQK